MYGIIFLPAGIDALLQVLLAGRWGDVKTYTSAFSGEISIRLQSPTVDFETERHLESYEYGFNGAADGTPGEVIEFVRSLSEALRRDGISHHLEVYDDKQKMAAEFQHSR